MSTTVMNVLDHYFPYIAPHLQTLNQTATQNKLYGAVDLSEVSWLERTWAAYYIWMGNELIATGCMSFLLHEIVYFGRGLPFWIMDQFDYFAQWKLQEKRLPTNAEYWHCTKVVLLTHFTCELPLIYVFHPICEYFGMATYQIPFTPVWKMVAQIAFFFFFEDMFHYWAHRGLHWGPLYKHIHRMHHKYNAPFGIAAEYAHPLEVLILAQGTISGPFMYCLFRDDLHIFTVYVWIALRLFQAIDAHSGYDFPISLRHFLPFWAGASRHDFHHKNFLGNYATSFVWWDWLCGTDRSFHAYQARRAEEKLKLKQQKSL